MRKKTDLPVQVPSDKKQYIVTDRITGFINFKQISANRGDKVYLTADEAKVFKDSILEL